MTQALVSSLTGDKPVDVFHKAARPYGSMPSWSGIPFGPVVLLLGDYPKLITSSVDKSNVRRRSLQVCNYEKQPTAGRW